MDNDQVTINGLRRDMRDMKEALEAISMEKEQLKGALIRLVAKKQNFLVPLGCPLSSGGECPAGVKLVGIEI